MPSTPVLISLSERIREKLRSTSHAPAQYAVPGLWLQVSDLQSAKQIVKIDPYRFFLDAIDAIIRSQPETIQRTRSGGWTGDAVIYNMFVRTTCAFDHDQNGKLDFLANNDGWKETGTFLKAIALLPYVKSLGVNTIHLLPITSVGKDGNKGSLGSPYAIKNPYELDSNLCEPNIGLGVEEEFKAFVEAAHHLGIRVVVEFVFRTSAKDGDWVKEHPDWYYWIKESVEDRQPNSHDETKYGAPVFTHEELQKIHAKVDGGDFNDVLPPHKIFLDMFTDPPEKESIVPVGGTWIGTLPDGVRVRIPGAFADWPPDDSQPPWGDVTYLKMYSHPDFNYIAYNTLRMYDARLARKENINQPLWEKIASIIPHYQKTFGIDGVMIDMGHALPMELKQEMIRRARSIDPDFAFWDENFSVAEQSVKEGYNAVIGYQWIDQQHPSRFKRMLQRFSGEGFALPFFATPESHNTPRAATRTGGIDYAKYAWAVSNFIPAIPFIHSGFELGETYPINTGLDFTKEELMRYPSEQLPLFSEHVYDWLNKNQFVDWISKVSTLRKKFERLVVDPSPQSFIWVETHHHDVIAFIRSADLGKTGLLVVANSNMHHGAHASFEVHTGKKSLPDLLSDASVSVEYGRLKLDLAKAQVAVFEL
jgi:glycosidase